MRTVATSVVQEYLETFRESLGLPKTSSDISYVSVNKDTHVLEVPERFSKKVPVDFHACAAKKGVKRYSSTRLEELVAARKAKLEAVELAQLNILQVLVARFVKHKDMWLQVCPLPFPSR
jgi:DNA mismatch repair protein MSH6